MDPEERANVNVSPDVPSPILFFLSLTCEHRSHAEATPVTYVRMPVARSTLLERPYQAVNSSAKGFSSRVRRPFFVRYNHFSRHLSEYIDPATMIIKIDPVDNKYGRSSGQSMYLPINHKDICSIMQGFLEEGKLLMKKFILHSSFFPCLLIFAN